jgi:hypothetical protein
MSWKKDELGGTHEKNVKAKDLLQKLNQILKDKRRFEIRVRALTHSLREYAPSS